MRPRLLVLALLLALGGGAQAATVLIRDATVHTVTAAGVQQHTDILIRDGYVAELGQALRAPADAVLIEAAGRAVTPGLFGGAGHLDRGDRA
jgi:imidazolonepropionase-like amidohydrolase